MPNQLEDLSENPSLDDLPPLPEENPRQPNRPKLQKSRRSRQGRPPGAGATPSSGSPRPGANPYREIQRQWSEGMGAIGTGVAGYSPLAGLVLGGSTIAPPVTEAKKTPEERSEYIGGLVARAAQQSPLLFAFLSRLAIYTIWGEVALLIAKLGLAAALDAEVLDEKSMVGLVAMRLLKDERATLDAEKKERGAVERGPSANGGQPVWRSVAGGAAGDVA